MSIEPAIEAFRVLKRQRFRVSGRVLRWIVTVIGTDGVERECRVGCFRRRNTARMIASALQEAHNDGAWLALDELAR